MNCKDKRLFPDTQKSLFSKGLKSLAINALKEDLGGGDITSGLLIPKGKKASASIILKQDALICGLMAAKEVFLLKDKSLKFKPLCKDADLMNKGSTIAIIKGNARSILAAERAAINFISHLSGIATHTNKFLQKVKPYRAKISDTRKTIPGLRLLEKYAVACGGGYNHRLGLGDAVLVKDNHLALLPLKENWQKIKSAKCRLKNRVKFEIEVKDLEEFRYALKIKPDIIMLDNMAIDKMKQAVYIKNNTGNNILLEASGGINLDNVRDIAKTGVDIISIGKITNSSAAIDLSLEII